jgi:hypothetical protein
MLPYAKHELIFTLSLMGLLIFSFFMIRKTLPIKYFGMVDYIKERKFILHLIVLIIIISIIVSKLVYMYKNGENESDNFKRIKHSLQVSLIAFFIAFFAKFELIFVPFYFIFIMSFFMESI